MRIFFKNCPNDILKGIELLSDEFGFNVSKDGIPVTVEKRPGNPVAFLEDGKGGIKYESKIHFFRALGLFIQEIQSNNYSFYLEEEPQFDLIGAKFDVSRNAVLTLSSIKKLLRKMSIMGHNIMMLYIEDIYTIKNEPWFGYMRGRYSEDELKQIAEYAKIFGIETVPSIQTLGHLKEVLKWPAYSDIKDNDRVLLVGEDKVYELIEKMIASTALPLKSRRIHIGMDEAWGLGLGEYFKRNGLEDKFDIFTKHLERVLQITKKYGLKPMICSDMYFRMGSKNEAYYDLDVKIPDYVKNKIPEDLKLVYWDYYHTREDTYKSFIKIHKSLGRVPAFGGGILAWGTFCTNYNRTFVDTNSALAACKKEGVKEAFANIWGDDGNENNIFTTLLGLQLYAEHAYAKEPGMEKLKKRVKFCTGIDYDAFMDLSYLDETPGVNLDTRWPANVSKYTLWQDILMGLFDKDIEGLNLSEHYGKLRVKLDNHIENNPDSEYILRVPEKLCAVLELKSEMGLEITELYKNNDIEGLKRIVKLDLPETKRRISLLRDEHRKQWLSTYKPFGWEVIDIRYGGLVNRIDTACKRIKDYIENKIDIIEELEEEKLNIDKTPDGLGKGFWKKYKDIVTANVFGDH